MKTIEATNFIEQIINDDIEKFNNYITIACGNQFINI